MLGKDGRIYDRSFDSDHDGSLNAYERSMMITVKASVINSSILT